MIPCLLCGSKSKELSKDYDRDNHRIDRKHKCINGHEFNSVQVYPSQLSDKREFSCAINRINKRWETYKRHVKIVNDPRSLEAIAEAYNLTPARVRQIRASFSTSDDWLGWSKIALRNLERKNDHEG